jgi:hypothetical protein
VIHDDDLDEALRSVQRLIARDSRDWSADRHDAFLYGVFVGWGAEQERVAGRHAWDEDFVARLDRLHGGVRRAMQRQGETT